MVGLLGRMMVKQAEGAFGAYNRRLSAHRCSVYGVPNKVCMFRFLIMICVDIPTGKTHVSVFNPSQFRDAIPPKKL